MSGDSGKGFVVDDGGNDLDVVALCGLYLPGRPKKMMSWASVRARGHLPPGC